MTIAMRDRSWSRLVPSSHAPVVEAQLPETAKTLHSEHAVNTTTRGAAVKFELVEATRASARRTSSEASQLAPHLPVSRKPKTGGD